MLSTHTTPNSISLHVNGFATCILRDGLLDIQTIQKNMDIAIQQGISLISQLVRSNTLSSQKILACCVKYFALPVFDLKNYDISELNKSLIKIELIYRYRIIPLNQGEDILYLGISDPTNYTAISAISFHTGLPIHLMLVDEAKLDKIINQHSASTNLGSQLESKLAKITPVEDKSSPYEITEDDGPISEFVDKLIGDAIAKNVSDIHIEPYSSHCRIRFRRDGLLYEAATIALHLATRIITRLKIMSNLNIAERRLPQDGRLHLQHESKIDIRINTCPTLFGEKIVLRILDANKITLHIDTLGFNETQKQLFLSKLKQPHGLILVTGPTGSGKTVTLYSALHYLNKIEKNISSVEDPIEIDFFGINQVNVNPNIALDFSTTLRTFLRQDPDIIMVGEIRDRETANIAMQAAQTGHLVLSTLHTNNAIDTLLRLQSMGASTYHIIHSVSLIIAQRLIRKLCNHCKQVDTHHHNLNLANCLVYQPIGCEHCNNGYQGRTGIFELLPMTEEIADLILNHAPTTHLSNVIQNENWMLLWEAGLEKIKNGQTSYLELIRVLGEER